MQDLLTRLSSLNRPRLLVRAARIGASNYCRNRHLQRVLGYGQLPKYAKAIVLLIEQEQNLNRRRLKKEPGYQLTRHVEVLIAMMGEARLLAKNQINLDKTQTATKSGSRLVTLRSDKDCYENASDIDAFFSST
ncbi:hypothetical protein DL239_07515 [Sedimentitalea sp. CY04]|uniref:Uncharacterized protein n=1 Tax=Parasedimentitalea denitrificans TaxID=2211118 RepID=A0ABX0W5A8_9RHOB|nr:DUF6477 family protein [Sedimentitalea sp. CY04]NIZ60819.1 hypothetical protein [Sedimentitalea sp. CY04]